jgi:hypothetical protein
MVRGRAGASASIMNERSAVIIIIAAMVVALLAVIFGASDSKFQVVTLCGVAIASTYTMIKTSSTAAKVDGLKQVADETHVKVAETLKYSNAMMGLQLEVGAAALRRVADLTGKPEDEAIATKEEEALASHREARAAVDKQALAEANAGKTP